MAAVCSAAAPALGRNLKLATALEAALAYNAAKGVKGNKTKAKMKVVKTKAVKDTTDKLTKAPAKESGAGSKDAVG